MTAAAMRHDADPVGALADMLDQIDVSINRTHRRAKSDEKARLNMLKVHGGWAIVVGLLFAANGKEGTTGPIYQFLRWIPGFPYSLALLLLAGGLILLPATILRHRPAEMIGASILALWYGTISLGFGIPVLIWSAHAAANWSADLPLPPGRPGMHGPGVYGHFCNVLLVHLVVLWRRERDARTGL